MDDYVLSFISIGIFKDKPWLSAIILAVIATIIGTFNIFDLGSNWLHRLHTVAFFYGYYFSLAFTSKRG